MTRVRATIVAMLLAAGVGVYQWCPSIVFAQSYPIVKTVAWDANPASDGVTGYTMRLDGGAPTNVSGATLTAPVSIPSGGAHTITVTATNTWGIGPAATLTILVVGPSAPTNLRLQ